MQLYAVNFIPLLSSLYMFRAAHTPIIRSTTVSTATGKSKVGVGCHGYLFPRVPGTACLAPSGTSSRDNLRQPMIVPVAVDTVVLLMMGVCAARNM